MKQYTSKDQTTKLIELGFPKPKFSFPIEDNEHPDYVDEEGIPWSYAESYSIGELIEFLESNTDINIWYDGKSHYWYVDYGLRRVGVDANLVDSLYFACKALKEEEVI